jgi:hypothetical protein
LIALEKTALKVLKLLSDNKNLQDKSSKFKQFQLQIGLIVKFL